MRAIIPPSQKQPLTIADVTAALRRQLGYLFLPPILLVCLAGAYLTVAHRYYAASSQIEISGSNKNMVFDTPGGSTSTDALEVNSMLQTQARILTSEQIALRVIKDLNLEETPTFKISATPPPGKGPALETSPERTDHALTVFGQHLTAQVIPSTRLLQVRYTDRDPQRAAAVVNLVVQALIDYNFQTRYNASKLASGWLGEQLTELRSHSEQLQARVLQMQQDSGVLASTAVDGDGRSQSFSPALERVRAASDLLLQAQTNTVLKRAIYDAAKDGKAEAISALSGTALANSSPGVNSSLSVLQGLRGQEAALQQQVDQARTKYGARFPRLVELQSSLDAVHHSIDDEARRISDRAENDYRIAQVAESADRRLYDQARRDALGLNGRAAEYDLLRQEADESRKLYEDLLRHLQEAGIVQGLHASDLTIVDRARPPSKPSRPDRALILGASLLAGVFFGLVLVFAVETLGDKIVSGKALESVSGKRPLARLPIFRGEAPSEAFLEALRALRSRLLRGPEAASRGIILVTSAGPKEGKSTVAQQLASSLAQYERKVLLVDADLRSSTITTRLNGGGKRGLAEILANPNDELSMLKIDGSPGLDVLPSGNSSKPPSDLFESPAFREYLAKWRKEYRFILLDAPAVLQYSDALSLAAVADEVFVVCRESVVSTTNLRACLAALSSVTADNNIDLILSAVRRTESQ